MSLNASPAPGSPEYKPGLERERSISTEIREGIRLAEQLINWKTLSVQPNREEKQKKLQEEISRVIGTTQPYEVAGILVGSGRPDSVQKAIMLKLFPTFEEGQIIEMLSAAKEGQDLKPPTLQ